MRSLLFSFRRSVFISIILLFFTATAYSADNDIPQRVLELQKDAIAFEKVGDFAEAREQYRTIIDAYPHTAYGFDASIKTARSFMKQKQYENIVPIVKEMCANFDNQHYIVHAASDLARDCMYAEAESEAIAICENARKQLSGHPRAMLLSGTLGMVYASQGDIENAEKVKQSILQQEDCIASDFLKAIGDIGWGYYCSGKLDRALETYRQGLEKNSTHEGAVHLQYQIIKTHVTGDEFAAADAEMDVLLKNYSHCEKTPGLAFRVANEYYKKWNLEGAINAYEKLLTQFGDHELAPAIRGMEIKSYKMMAKGFRRSKEYDRAITAYQTVLGRFPADEQVPSIQDAIVETYADAGDLPKAQQALQTDIEKYPHRVELLRVIARVAVHAARAGQTDTAMELAKAIFDQNPEDADQQLFGYTTLARVYVYQGNDTNAEAVVDKAIQQFQDYPDVLAYHLFGVGEEYYLQGVVDRQKGNTDGANENFLKAIQFWNKNITEIHSFHQEKTHYYAGLCYQNIGQIEKALEYFQKVTTDWPTSQSARDALSQQVACLENLYAAEAITDNDYSSQLEHIYACAIETFPDMSLLNLSKFLGKEKWESQQWTDAITYLEKFLNEAKQSQKTSDVYFMLAQAYENSGDQTNAALNYSYFIDRADPINDETRWIEAINKTGH